MGEPIALELMNLAAAVAREAGDAVARGRRSGVGDVRTKSSSTDLVTQWDTSGESLIRARLSAARPHDGILGEEGDTLSGTSGITWVIDPIDGTTNFAYGLSGYTVSVAAVDELGSVAGAVFIPDTRELFVAARSMGAWLAGRRLECSRHSVLATSLVGTGFSYDADTRARQFRFLGTKGGEMRDIRRMGAASADLCSVACGRLDAYFESGLQIWDIAAGALIASEAGAMVTDFRGGPQSPQELQSPQEMLACSPGIHAQFVAFLASRTPD